MSVKHKILLVVVAAIVIFAFGRYSAPSKVITKTITVEKKVVDKNRKVEKEKHLKTVVVEEIKPDGTKVVTTTTTEDTDTKSDTDVVIHDDKETASTKEVTRGGSRVSLSALAGTKLSISQPLMPIYGASIQKDLIGPINMGIFGLSDGVGGVSLGVSF